MLYTHDNKTVIVIQICGQSINLHVQNHVSFSDKSALITFPFGNIIWCDFTCTVAKHEITMRCLTFSDHFLVLISDKSYRSTNVRSFLWNVRTILILLKESEYLSVLISCSVYVCIAKVTGAEKTSLIYMQNLTTFSFITFPLNMMLRWNFYHLYAIIKIDKIRIPYTEKEIHGIKCILCR